MEDITIRRCTENDIDSVCALQEEWVDAHITYGMVTGDMVGLDDRNTFLSYLGPYFLVAEEKGVVVGYISASKQVVEEDTAIMPGGTAYIEIDNIYVTPSHRDRGIGGRMLECVFEQARRDRISKAQVYSATKDMHRIMRFYESHGFESWHIRMFRDL